MFKNIKGTEEKVIALASSNESKGVSYVNRK